MEGLIPYICRAISGQRRNDSWLSNSSSPSPSASYMRLPTGDSGRHQTPSESLRFFSSAGDKQPVIRRSDSRRFKIKDC
ncbi:hypothetical protein KFK09_010394 [Dendrobium nobile]|uniref:Uncharacterized protein n=1 Tax=Dendrobium nobile TaxID=94219 RepID=A0A8T3BFI7_DENNO|nr:hypothetical protein KFK09_010394 [Dendrobium nobile]